MGYCSLRYTKMSHSFSLTILGAILFCQVCHCCLFLVTEPHGEITSPNYPDNYAAQTNCYWIFTATPGNKIKLDFNDFQLEHHDQCDFDRVLIMDGLKEDSPILGKYCGSKDPFTVSSTGNHMLLKFLTDPRTEATGFKAAYEIGTEIFVVRDTRTKVVTWLKYKWGWDDDDIHRTITALYLTGNATFDRTDETEELMAKQLELRIALAQLRNETIPVKPTQVALYIDAMLVTCHNPRSFYGFDLVSLLKKLIEVKENSPNPIVYVALCNANETISEEAVEYLLSILKYEAEFLFWTDIQAMSVIALSCIANQTPHAHIQQNITDATANFKELQRTDGSFGNIYTSALVVQALLASGNEFETDWDLEGAINYFISKQNSSADDSFGDLLSTYLILPILNKKTLADIVHVKCNNLIRQSREEKSALDFKDYHGPSVPVLYSLYIGDDRRIIHSISLKVPLNVTVYDVMNVAAEADSENKFGFEKTSSGLYIYSIAGTANDPESWMFWMVHLGKINSTDSATLRTESPDKIYIKGGEHIIMWYKTVTV